MKPHQHSDVTNQTIEYYNKNADEFYKATVGLDMSPIYEPFLRYIPHNGHILDAGCGSGRDSLYFVEHGYRVTAFDASQELVKRASLLLKQPVMHLRFQDMTFASLFDGIWASASLLHVPLGELQAVIKRLTTALVPSGVLYISFKYGEGQQFRHERHFTDMDETSLQSVLRLHNELVISKMWRTQDVRPSRKTEEWLNVILTKVEGTKKNT